jgi:N-acetylmuramoyl-L-alanine amidase
LSPFSPFTIAYYCREQRQNEVTILAVVATNTEDVKLLARLMRAEAEGEGRLGMLMVGNVGVNRVIADCLDFRGLRTIRQMVFQRPGGFEATQKGYFYQAARDLDIQLARQVIRGWRYHPATNSLWFFKPEGDCPPQWFNQQNVGRYKSHCFFAPTRSNCPRVY